MPHKWNKIYFKHFLYLSGLWLQIDSIWKSFRMLLIKIILSNFPSRRGGGSKRSKKIRKNRINSMFGVFTIQLSLFWKWCCLKHEYHNYIYVLYVFCTIYNLHNLWIKHQIWYLVEIRCIRLDRKWQCYFEILLQNKRRTCISK